MQDVANRTNTDNRLRQAPIRRILAPLWLGAERPGVESGAEVLSRGLAAAWNGRADRFLPPVDIPVSAPVDAMGRLHQGALAFLPAIAAMSEALAASVRTSIRAGELAVILGGDHAVAIGSVAGAAGACQRLGVLWLDAHLDLNTPETSPTGHIHGMPLAASLGHGPGELTAIGGRGVKIAPSDLAVLGIRDVDAGELALVARAGIWTRSAEEWRQEGILAGLDAALAHLSSDGIDAIHVSIDVDALDPSVMPGTGTAVPGGLFLDELTLAIDRLRAWNAPVRSIDFVELNPSLDASGGSADVAISLLARLLHGPSS